MDLFQRKAAGKESASVGSEGSDHDSSVTGNRDSQAHGASAVVPLAEKLRPATIEDLVGHQQTLGTSTALYRAIVADRCPSMVLWGPPGCGKTSVARLVAKHSTARFTVISAVLSGVAELRQALQSAELARTNGSRTILFIDEIHRFNKGQQDALLPQLEAGVVTLIGATTENPSFALNAALLSRMRVVRLEPLTDEALTQILLRAASTESIVIPPDVLQGMVRCSDGDARRGLNLFEQVVTQSKHGAELSLDLLTQLTQSRSIRYDRAGEEHYNLASALIKSLRGSDPDASLYWAVRMIESGEDPLFVLRRLLIFAAEDIGMADPRAIETVAACDQAFQRVGLPEGMIPLAHAVTYLALAPKSKAVYLSLRAVQEEIKRSGALPVPGHIRQSASDAPYQDPHKSEEGWVPVHYLPKAIERRFFYVPTARGMEAKARETLLKRRSKRDGTE